MGTDDCISVVPNTINLSHLPNWKNYSKVILKTTFPNQENSSILEEDIDQTNPNLKTTATGRHQLIYKNGGDQNTINAFIDSEAFAQPYLGIIDIHVSNETDYATPKKYTLTFNET